MEKFERLWNWKKYPSAVFLIAIPLAIIGLGSMFLLALLKLIHDGNPWFMVIFAAVGGLGAVTVASIIRTHREFIRKLNGIE